MKCICLTDSDTFERLRRHFGFKHDLILRAEQVFYFELCKRLPELKNLERYIDVPITEAKGTSLYEPKPDQFHFLKGVGLHGEHDEHSNHEQSRDREEIIAAIADCPKWCLHRTVV
jgi:hypothetical protein